MPHMHFPAVLLIVVFVIRANFCVGLDGGVQPEVREVAIDSADARVIGFIDTDSDKQLQLEETPWEEEAVPPSFLDQHGLPEIPYHGFLGPMAGFNFTSPRLQSAWVDLFDGTMLDNFLQRCERELGDEESITRNLSAMQAFVAFIVIGYTAVAMWIGPITLSRWQRRTLLATYAGAGLVQAIFLAQVFGFMPVRVAYPLTMATTLCFFLTFNCTNALLLLEPEEAEAAVNVPQIIESSPNRVVTSQRARCY